MRKKLIICGVILLISLIVVVSIVFYEKQNERIVPTVSNKTVDINSFLPKVTGNWLNENFVNALNTTKSPVRAMEGVSEVYFEITPNNGTYNWLKIYNFHEGVTNIITGLNYTEELDSYALELKNEDGSMYEGPECRFGLTDQPEINKIVYFDGDITGNFIRIQEKAESYINKIVLVGKYRDSKGLLYEFTADFRANWPTESFKYDLNIDPVFQKYDYFWVLDKNDQNSLMFYCFERKDNQLILYRGQLGEDEFIIREEQPFLVLEKVE